MRFTPKPVSKWFLLDWQFILATGRMPVLKPAAVVISALPIVTDIAQVIPISTTGFWLFWVASILSLCSVALTYIFCPKFIRDYEDFKAFNEMGHTHRWIVWLFHTNLDTYDDRKHVVRETIDKALTLKTDEYLAPAIYAVCPVCFSYRPASDDPFVSQPVNIHRDIYVPMWVDRERYVLALQETDPQLETKIKELFWIIFTDLTKKAPLARHVIWGLYAIILVLTIAALAINVAKPLLRATPEVVSPLVHIGRIVCRLLQ